jgi:hypothetical protein
VTEIWKPIFGGVYSVSNLGRVRREMADRPPAKAGFVLKPRISKRYGGYLTVGLKNGQRVSTAFVHRLVAEAFLGPCPAGLEVNHKNRDKTDPRLENLEYVTHVENIRHSYRTGRRHSAGETNGHAKLTEAEVRTIRALRARGVPIREVASRYSVTQSTISVVASRRTWRHVA